MSAKKRMKGRIGLREEAERLRKLKE